MEAQTRRGKRDRVDVTAEANDSKPAARAIRSPLEESVTFLAGVAGAVGSSIDVKRNAALSASSPNKRAKITKTAATKKDRSESIDQLISVAGSLLDDSTATAAAIASNSATTNEQSAVPPSSLSLVPNPIVLQQESTTLTYANAASIPASAPAPPLPPPSSNPKPKKKNSTTTTTDPSKKTQVQYNPDVPMTKEQLTAWRREMRRVRNRESAAASRRKVRDRIEELEEEVDVWKKRYEEAMVRLGRAEAKSEEGKSEET